jgi:hypothetical protein
MIITTIVAALLLPGVVLSRQDEGMIFMPAKNKALYLGWGSYVDTQLDFSSFFNADHTVMAWFMPQYPHASSGPIFAVNGAGKYQIGQDDYRLGDGGPRKDADGKAIGDKGRPVFSIQVGYKKAIYLLDEFIAGQWQHIAVVRRASKFELYLNGMRRTPVKNIDKVTNTSDWDDEITVDGSFAWQPSGTLRFGRVSPGRSDNRQAYGLLDDVAVFNKALKWFDINKIIMEKRLTGAEDGLLAGWCFDRPTARGAQLLRKLDSYWNDVPRASIYKVEATTGRISSQDRGLFDNPFMIGQVSKELRLPFNSDEVWYVIQGYDDPGSSHNGYAAFCYDFKKQQSKAGKLEYPEGTSLAPVYAAAPAKVNTYSKFCAGQQVSFKLGEYEHMSYLHLAKDTLSAKFTGGSCKLTGKDCNGQVTDEECSIPAAQAQTVQQDELIAKVDPGAYHLHFATGNGVAGTIPAAFTDYYVSTDGNTWTKVLRGHPKAGQFIKRMN